MISGNDISPKDMAVNGVVSGTLDALIPDPNVKGRWPNPDSVHTWLTGAHGDAVIRSAATGTVIGGGANYIIDHVSDYFTYREIDEPDKTPSWNLP